MELYNIYINIYIYIYMYKPTIPKSKIQFFFQNLNEYSIQRIKDPERKFPKKKKTKNITF